MMGTYIKGFKPQDGLYVIKDGVIRKYKGNGGTVRPYELIEVKEPHGRLIDADEIVKDLGRDLQRAYDEGYKQGRYDEKVETETSLPSGEQTHALRTETHACDSIKRQDAIDALREEVEWEYDENDEQWYYIEADMAIGAIERLPSAQPEIIRCKDCKHFAGEGMYCSCDIIVQFDHFYCYHAERRQDV